MLNTYFEHLGGNKFTQHKSQAKESSKYNEEISECIWDAQISSNEYPNIFGGLKCPGNLWMKILKYLNTVI